jgi:hypothetical protein
LQRGQFTRVVPQELVIPELAAKAD